MKSVLYTVLLVLLPTQAAGMVYTFTSEWYKDKHVEHLNEMVAINIKPEIEKDAPLFSFYDSGFLIRNCSGSNCHRMISQIIHRTNYLY